MKLRRITYVFTVITLVIGMASMAMCALDGFGFTHIGIRSFLGL